MLAIYIIKQDFRKYTLSIAGQTAEPIGLQFFCGHSWAAEGCYRLKKRTFFFKIFFFQIIFFEGNAGPALQLVIHEKRFSQSHFLHLLSLQIVLG